MWQEPIFDRTNADTLTARAGQSNIDNHKGALNYQDLNRIEGNYKHIVNHLFSHLIVVPHTPRNYAETTYGYPREEYGALPKGYTPLTFIESDGTQYLDTEFMHNQNTRIVMEAQVVSQPTQHAWLFEGRTSNTSAAKGMFLRNGDTWCIDYSGSNFRAIADTIGVLEYLKIDYDKSSLKINDYVHSYNPKTFQSTCTLVLFAANTAGTVSGYIAARVYMCKIYDNNTLIRNYVPCKSPEGIAGLFDVVNNKFYKSSGSSDFIAGTVVSRGIKVDVYNDWQERNIPWHSEMDRIRDNYNNLVRIFLHSLNLPVLESSQFLMYSEVNDWERIALTGKQMLENMEKERIHCGTIYCGGDRLL